MISAEEFAIWRDDPVTQGVLQALSIMADAQREGWIAASWEGGEANHDFLIELKTRADAYRVFAEGSYEDFFGVDA